MIVSLTSTKMITDFNMILPSMSPVRNPQTLNILQVPNKDMRNLGCPILTQPPPINPPSWKWLWTY